MSLEKNTDIENKSASMDFEILERGDVKAYLFKHAFVGIDRSGKNQKDLPEISFGH